MLDRLHHSRTFVAEMKDVSTQLIDSAIRLRNSVEEITPILLDKQRNIDWIYHPLRYAWEPHKEYLNRFGNLGAKSIMLGMNPGHGMGNTGIPFGCPEQVKQFLNIIDLKVEKPAKLHPKRPVYGLECPKAEVSGRRIWTLLKQCFGTPEQAMSSVFITNHCPIWMFNEKGQNVTPDKLSGDSADSLMEKCDEHLVEVCDILQVERVIGVGKYAERRALQALKNLGRSIKVESIPHPSPANPMANRNGGEDWRRVATEVLL